MLDALKLRFGEQGRALAQVTNLDQPRRGQTVRYRFQPYGSAQSYTHVNFLGREVGAKVMEDAWLEAKSTGTITVVYNKSQPRLNLPVAAAPIEGWAVRAVGTAFLGAIALLIWRRWAKPVGAPREATVA